MKQCSNCKKSTTNKGKPLELNYCVDCKALLCFWCWEKHPCTIEYDKKHQIKEMQNG